MTPPTLEMERAISALALELPAEVWEDVRDRWHAAKDALVASYNAKVDDLARETRRVAQHQAVIQRLLRNGIPIGEVIEARHRDNPEWKPYKPIDAVFQPGWAPPIEAEIIRSCWDAEFGAYAWAVENRPTPPDEPVRASDDIGTGSDRD